VSVARGPGSRRGTPSAAATGAATVARAGVDQATVEAAAAAARARMPDMLAAGMAVAAAAAVCFEVSYLLQAFEARKLDPEVPAAGVLPRLMRRRLWLAGLALAGAGAVLQVLALGLAPLTAVQPTLALGIVALVAVGGRVFGEPVTPSDLVAAAALAGGVALLGLAGAGVESEPVNGFGAAIALGALGAVLLVALVRRGAPPLLLVLGAGAGDALVALAAKRLADALDITAIGVAVGWLAVAAFAVAAGLSVEMAAVRRWPATRVGPFVLVCQTVVPVLLAPVVVGENWGPRAPAVVAGLALVGVGGWRLAASAGLLERGKAPEQDVGGGGQREP